MLSEKAREAIRAQMGRYPVPRSALGHALYIAQEECGGWVPTEAIRDVAEVMDLEPADVQSTMSFYVMYNKVPTGRYMIEICHNISCALLGAGPLLEVMHRKCGIGPGETSEDGLFTLKGVECLAACEGAPVLQLNGMYQLHMTPEKLEEMIDRLRGERAPGESIYNAVYTPEQTRPEAGE